MKFKKVECKTCKKQYLGLQTKQDCYDCRENKIKEKLKLKQNGKESN